MYNCSPVLNLISIFSPLGWIKISYFSPILGYLAYSQIEAPYPDYYRLHQKSDDCDKRGKGSAKTYSRPF